VVEQPDDECRLLVAECYTSPMRVLGIDCGTEYTGYGVVDLLLDSRNHDRLVCIICGAIKVSPRDPMPLRLSRISIGLQELILEHRPDRVAIEEVFYSANVKSALKLGQVRGVAMLAAASAGLEVAEYSPLSIKSAVVGYGRAEKHQVQQMVTRLLNLDQIPQSADAADALAIAICHLHTAATHERQSAPASHTSASSYSRPSPENATPRTNR
jgi:crossover junction endodeoxyribonuclease RuvC